MSEFSYQDGLLFAEGVAVTELAKEFGSPCYVYSRKEIEARWSAFDSALAAHKHLICYAVKANSNLAVLNILARLGSGFDIVSAGELHRVIKAGGDTGKVVFSGVGKTPDEMAYALEKNIKCFNVESANELVKLNAVAASLNVSAPVSLRVNPDVDAETHPYISTGLKENKFGIAFESAKEVYQEAAAMANINIVGIDCHIGSQITTLSPFEDALQRVLVLVNELEQSGIDLEHIDIGGGLGITYQDEQPPAPDAYANAIIQSLANTNYEIIMEPGRSIVGNAGILLTEVQYLNATPYHNFAVVDAANAEEIIYDVVGPVCETGDFLGKDRPLRLKQGDLLAVCSAGAYGFTMASNYNSRPRVAELMVDGDQVYEVRKRESIEDLMNGESLLPE